MEHESILPTLDDEPQAPEQQGHEVRARGQTAPAPGLWTAACEAGSRQEGCPPALSRLNRRGRRRCPLCPLTPQVMEDESGFIPLMLNTFVHEVQEALQARC